MESLITNKCQGVWSVVIAVNYRRPSKDLNRLSINVPWTPNTQLPGVPVRMRFYLGHKMLWVESKLQHPTNTKTSLLAITNGHHWLFVCVCFLLWLLLCLNDFLFVVGSLFWFLVFWSFWFSSLNFLSLFWESRKENMKLGRKGRK